MKLRSLVAASVIALSASATQAAEFINVLTGGTSGVYYPLGVALTQLYGKVMPGCQDLRAGDESQRREPQPAAGRPRRSGVLAGRYLQRGLEGQCRSGFRHAAEKAAHAGRDLPELHPLPRQRRFRHQIAGRPEGQARFRRRAEEWHRAQQPRHSQGGRHELQGSRQGRIPRLFRIGRADQEPPARCDAAVVRPRRRGGARSGDRGEDRRDSDSRRRRDEDRRSGLHRPA